MGENKDYFDYVRKNRRRNLRHKFVQLMACAVVFCTTYALILPALTMEGETWCGMEAHTHDESCLKQLDTSADAQFLCELGALGVHSHTDACYDADGACVCGYADYVLHSHNAFCLDASGNLICTMPEITEHVHTDACYSLPEAHTHDGSCYVQTRGELTCPLDEVEGHSHTADCYDREAEPLCGQEPVDAHAHSAECYEVETVTVCGLESHPHTDACFAPGAAVCGMEEHSHGSGCYGEAPLVCGREIHVHSDGCYATDGELACGLEVHTHGDSCYGEAALICGATVHSHEEGCFGEPVLICGLDSHPHTDSCFDRVERLICGREESAGHVHTDACFPLTCPLAEEEGHTHSDGCYAWTEELVCHESAAATGETLEPVLSCGREEITAHTHQDCCRDAGGDLICGKTELLFHDHTAQCVREAEPLPLTCGLEESDIHQHDALCYGTWEYDCGLEAHSHSLACFSNPEADVEDPQTWERMTAGLALTGNYPEDLAAIAGSQLGYRESESNYRVLEDGVTVQGYTRYGAWAGTPYEDWNSLFVAFCLEYARIPVELFPRADTPAQWVDTLADAYYDLYHAAGSGYEPKAGDVVFLRTGDSGSGTAEPTAPDTVGILLHVSQTQLTFALGDSQGAVEQQTLSLFDPALVGYGEVISLPMLGIVLTDMELTADQISDIVFMDAQGNVVSSYAAGEPYRLEISYTGLSTDTNYTVSLDPAFDNSVTVKGGSYENETLSITPSQGTQGTVTVTGIISSSAANNTTLTPIGIEAGETVTVSGKYLTSGSLNGISLKIKLNCEGTGTDTITGVALTAVTDEVRSEMLAFEQQGALGNSMVYDREMFSVKLTYANSSDTSGSNGNTSKRPLIGDVYITVAGTESLEGIGETGAQLRLFAKSGGQAIEIIPVDGQEGVFKVDPSVFNNAAGGVLLDVVVADPSKVGAGTYYDKLKLDYNTQKDAYIYDPAYAAFYDPNMPLGTAGNFHLVGFGKVTLNSHTNGNILAYELDAKNNFGTNQKAGNPNFKELHYIQRYSGVNAGSSASMEFGVDRPALDYLVIGSDNTLMINSPQGFTVNDKVVERPYNLVQDTNTADAPFIDLDRVEREIRDIASYLNALPDITNTAEFLVNLEQNNNYLELKNSNNIGVWHVTAAQLQEQVTTPLAIKGFSNQGTGAVIINVDMAGWPAGMPYTMPVARVWVDGQEQSAAETMEFSAGKVIWNFVNAEGKTINTQTMTGMVVAPGATVNIQFNLNGTVVAENINVNAESHRTDFTGKIYKNEFINTAHIHVHKVEKDNYGQFLAGATFQLLEYRNRADDSIENAGSWELAKQYKPENGSMVETDTEQTKTTAADGTVLFEGLKVDTLYKLVETQAPEGYKKDESPRYLYFKQEHDPPTGLTYLNTETGSNCIHYRFPNEKNTTDVTSIKVKKSWYDSNNNLMETAPQDTVWFKVVQYKKSGEDSAAALEATGQKWTYSVSASDGWQREIRNLPQDQSGLLVYKVEEISVPGYTTTYTGNEGQSNANSEIQIINTHMSQAGYIPLSVSKVWENSSGTALASDSVESSWSVTFDLYQIKSPDPQGRYYDPQNKKCIRTNIQLNSGNQWTWSTETGNDLPLYIEENGTMYYYFYYAVETSGQSGYSPHYGGDLVVDSAGVRPGGTASTSDDKLDLTIYNTQTASICLEKVWVDSAGNALSADADLVQVQILRKTDAMQDWETYGEAVTLSSAGNWEATVSGLPVYDIRGNLYSYKCEELHVPGFSTSYAYTTQASADAQAVTRDLSAGIPADAPGGKAVITNKQAPTTKITVEKQWKNASGETVDPPEDITVTVDIDWETTKDGKILEHGFYKHVTLPYTGADNVKQWEYTEENLPTTDAAGNSITYTVKEHDLSGWNDTYTTEQTEDGTKVTITNTPVSSTAETHITVNKQWLRKNGQAYTPDDGTTVTFNLIQTASTQSGETGDPVYVEFVNYSNLNTTGYPGQTISYLFTYTKINDQNPSWSDTYYIRYDPVEGQQKHYPRNVESTIYQEGKHDVYQVRISFEIPNDVKTVQYQGTERKILQIESFNLQGGGGQTWSGQLESAGAETAAAETAERVYGTYTLSGANNWTMTVWNLPLQVTDPFGTTEYRYSVVETLVNGAEPANDYTVSYEQNGNGITVRNTDKLNRTNLTVEKKWFRDGVQIEPVRSAIQFKLYQVCNGTATQYSYNNADTFTLSGPMDSTEPWTMTFRNLPLEGENGAACTYFVVEQPVAELYGVETQYSVGGNDSTVQNAYGMGTGSGLSSGDTITIKNTIPNDSYEMPATGGMGTAPCTLGGWAMLLCGAALLLGKRRRIP